ncbi:DUF7064 domain-containing protein [Novosphingobium lentum]|uniref:DUF7064 domain-containing protein n=1 Tax=Novosphingobium lentum TaxID=145287 RepID=UPI00082F8F0C|nr:hypothetical protein [Novosphingobium lentum]
MITARDVEFHTPADVAYDWAETTWLSIHIPEANLTVWTYLVARSGLGVMVCDIEAIDRIQRYTVQSRYFDFRQHMPLPARFDDFTLINGLSLKAVNAPRDYRIDYTGSDDTAFHWDVRGVMEPFDIHDPAMDPLASTDPNLSGFGQSYANHYDMTVHVTGTARIRGTTYPVDCVTTMDHSWGPRNESGMRAMGWINGNFDTDHAFSTIWTLDPFATGEAQFGFAHGYVLVDGEVRGLNGGRLLALRGDGVFPVGYDMLLTDPAGREYRFTGTVVNQTPWACYSNTMAINSTVRWNSGARVGHGLAQENRPLDSYSGRGLM